MSQVIGILALLCAGTYSTLYNDGSESTLAICGVTLQ
jgi:hypothetical protein